MARSAQQDSHIQLLHQEEVWDLTHQTLSDHVRLDVSGDVYSKTDLIDVILHAASSAGTIENSSDSLAHIGGGRGIRYHLNPLALDDLERDLNAALATHRPKRLLKRPRKVAIDVVLVPYYGTVDQADADFLIRSQAKVGTTRFFGYATLCLLHRHRRYTLALRCLRNSESLLDTLKALLACFAQLGGKIKRLFLDAGFYSVAICRYLIEEVDLPFVMPAPKKGRSGGIRTLLVGTQSYTMLYTMKSPTDGKDVSPFLFLAPLIVIIPHTFIFASRTASIEGKYQNQGIVRFAYVAYRWARPLLVVHEAYRQRFGNERGATHPGDPLPL